MLLATGLRLSSSASQVCYCVMGNLPDKKEHHTGNSVTLESQLRQRQTQCKSRRNQSHDCPLCAFPALLFLSLRTAAFLMTYLPPGNLFGVYNR